MKTTILILLASSFVLGHSAFGQATPAPKATPAPATPAPATPAPVFDALHLAPSRPPSGTPLPPTLAQKQAAYKAQVRALSAATFSGLAKQYATILALSATDDSATGGLTTAQKAAALTTAEKTELITNAWLIANLLNGIAPGTVPNPPTQ